MSPFLSPNWLPGDSPQSRLVAIGESAEFSAADLLLIMYLRWSRTMPRPALEWPALKRYATLLRARASWQRLYEIEQLSEWRS